MTHHTDTERAEFIQWCVNDGCTGDEMMAAHIWDNNYSEARAWKAARRAPAVPVETLETEYASCLAQCRDAFPVPDVNTELEGLWVAAMGCPLSVPEYIKAIAAAPQPTEAAQLDDTNVVDMAQAVDLKEAAPVQLPEPYIFWIEATTQFCIKKGGEVPFASAWEQLYTEQQVRELLAAHGIEEQQ